MKGINVPLKCTIADDTISPNGGFEIGHTINMPVECSVTILGAMTTFPESEFLDKLDTYIATLGAIKINSKGNNLTAYKIKTEELGEYATSEQGEGVLIERKNGNINLYPTSYNIHFA